MKVLIDMNLSQAWVSVFEAAGHDAVHWASVGRAAAEDHEIMVWARERDYVVLTIDLDFSAILAATEAEGPSVVQVRTATVAPAKLGQRLLAAMKRFESALLEGAIVTIDDQRDRARILPIQKRSGAPRED